MDFGQFINDATTLSFGERMLGSLITMCMGMGITFIVLLLIWASIAILGKLFGVKPTPAVQAAAPSQPKETPVVSAAPVAVQAEPEEDAEELIAVIAAAIAASTGMHTDKFVVQRIRRASTPAWAKAGSTECIDSRRI